MDLVTFKKIALVLLIGLSVWLSCAPAYSWYMDGEWVEGRCGICGKSIYTYTEGHFGPSMPSIGTDGRAWVGDRKEKATSLNIKLPRVCARCQEKYGLKLQEITDGFIEAARDESIDLISKHERERKEKEIELKRQKVKELTQELQILEKR